MIGTRTRKCVRRMRGTRCRPCFGMGFLALLSSYGSRPREVFSLQQSVVQSSQQIQKLVDVSISNRGGPPRCAVLGGGFAGMATVYELCRQGSEVVLYDPQPISGRGASAVSAGLLHPLTARGKLIWRGEDGFTAARTLIKVADDALGETCICCERLVRPILTDKQELTMTAAAKENPKWLTSLTAEALHAMAPGAHVDARGGVLVNGGMVIDSCRYLEGLWTACQQMGAIHMQQAITDVDDFISRHTFDVVVVSVGAAVSSIRGLKDLNGVRLVRGQSLLYSNDVDNVFETAMASGRATEASGDDQTMESAAVVTVPAATQETLKLKLKLKTAVLCGQYVVPTTVGGDSNLICGATQDHILYDDCNKPPDMDEAVEDLSPKVEEFYQGLRNKQPKAVTVGVRVIRDRSHSGRIPIVGRVPGYAKGAWVMTALGARGLIHHAYLARLLAAAAICEDEDILPVEITELLQALQLNSQAQP